MGKNKITSFIVLMLFSINTYCQTISKQVIASTGNSFNNTNNNVCFTIGETIVEIMTSSNYQVGSGYHQSLNMTLLSIENYNAQVSLKLYPNPVSAYLFIKQEISHPLLITIFDINGKTLLEKNMENDFSIDVSALTNGMYLAQIKDLSNSSINTYKFLKN
jgi:hypothetical protein